MTKLEIPVDGVILIYNQKRWTRNRQQTIPGEGKTLLQCTSDRH